MATQTLASDQPKADGPASATDRGLPHPALLGLASGMLLWLSFPPAEWSGAAWVALVPLFLLVDSKRSIRSVYLGSWVGGFVFWLLAIHWIWWTDDSAWLGWIVMAGFLSIWWPAFLFLARFARRRLNLPLIVAAPVFWVALEYIRAFVLTGFPWYYLAHSQYQLVYLTQIADFSGALGLSFLIALVNAFWVDLLTLPLFRRKPGGSIWVRLAPQRRRPDWSSSAREFWRRSPTGCSGSRRPSSGTALGSPCSSRTRSLPFRPVPSISARPRWSRSSGRRWRKVLGPT